MDVAQSKISQGKIRK
jgi:hypothetical protein